MADTPIANPFDGLQGIFDKIIGSKTVGTDQQSLTTEQLLQNLMQTISNQQQNTSGTQAQTSNQQTNQVVSSNADIGALQKVFQQQQAGVTPDMLKAIFSEGAKAVPQLVATTANAVGARPGSNSALATSLDSLNSNLVNQAAVLNQGMLKDSAITAAQIADLTKQQQTTGNTTGNTQLTTQQLLQNLIDQTQTQNQTTNTGQQKRGDTTSTTGINTAQTGAAAGLAGLAALLGGSGSSDMTNWLKSIPGLGNLFPGGGTVGSPNPSIPQDPNADSNPDLNGSPFDPVPMPADPGIGSGEIDWSGDGSYGGFADGGIVDPMAPKLLQITDTKTQAPNVSQLLSLLGVGGSSLGNGSSTRNTGGAGATAGVDPTAILGGLGGGEGPGAGGTGIGSVGSSVSPGSISGISPGQALGLIGAVVGMSPIGLAQAVASIASTATIGPSTIGPADLGMAPDAAAIGIADSDADANGSVGDDAGDSADAGDAGDAGDSGDSGGDAGGDGSGDGGGAGDGGDGGSGGDGGGGGDGGWANGGVIPKRKTDPKGILDKMTIDVSGGEAVIPTDVVDMMGPDFFHALIDLYHTPAAAQKQTQLVK